MALTRRLFPALAIALCAAAAPARAAGCPQPLRIGFYDSPTPPLLMGQGATFADPPGWEVDAVRDTLRRLGCEAELVRLPSRRLATLLAQGQVDFGLFFGITAERLRTLAFPLDAQGRPDLAWAPAFGHLSLFARAGTPPNPGWDGRQVPPGWRVGVMAGSVQEEVARERGWAVETISALELGPVMLRAQRFDLLMTSREALTAEQRADLVEWATSTRQPFFVPAAPAFARRHPAWTRGFWNEFCRSVRRLVPQARPVDCGIPPPAP